MRSLHSTRSPVMHRIATIFRVILLTLTTAALASALAGAAEMPSMEKFLKIRTPGDPVPLPDGSLLVIDRPEGIFQLYRFAPGGADHSFAPGSVTATKLTTYPDGISDYSLAPD